MSKKHDINDDQISYVILGSNLTENIIGAGLAIAGEKCIFLDQADRYGGYLSSFNLEHYWKYAEEKRSDKESNNFDGYSQFKILKSYDMTRHKSEKEFKSESRQYNLDLAPKLLFSKSTSVELLIKSGASNYLEFQNVPENYFFSQGKFVEIPFSKSEIFISNSLSLKEKR